MDVLVVYSKINNDCMLYSHILFGSGAPGTFTVGNAKAVTSGCTDCLPLGTPTLGAPTLASPLAALAALAALAPGPSHQICGFERALSLTR